MRFARVHLQALAYELPLVSVSTTSLAQSLAPTLARLGVAEGGVASLTGVLERRFWTDDATLAARAARAGAKALARGGLSADALDVVTYGGVCRDGLEPATACEVAARLGAPPTALVADSGNACLGLLTGLLDAAMKIEAGQARAALVVTCESARAVVEETIARLNTGGDWAAFQAALATLTGGSGAAAALLVDASLAAADAPRLEAAVWRQDARHHELCRWGFRRRAAPGAAASDYEQYMETDAPAVLKHGVVLGRETYRQLLEEWRLAPGARPRVIPHQVGTAHRQAMRAALELDDDQDYATYQWLGNMGTAALPVTAALAAERGFVRRGDAVAWLGIGSGLSCAMLGFKW